MPRPSLCNMAANSNLQLGTAKFVILGGGISGLSAAFYLAKKLKDPGSITVVEAGARLGGWIKSVITNEGAIFEQGPRGMRPAGEPGLATLSMISDLGIEDKVLPILPTHPGATKRFIFAKGQLHQLPSNLPSLFKKQTLLSKPLLPVILKESFVPARTDGKDETIYNFIQRRMNQEVAEYVIDPMIRGIFAGDVRELSMQSCLPPVYAFEKNHGSIAKGMLFSKSGPINQPISKIAEKARNERWSLWSLQGGLETLVNRLQSVLVDQGVHIKTNTPCTSVHFNSSGSSTVYLGTENLTADHVISSLPAANISKILISSHEQLAALLQRIGSVTVAVVNLEYEGQVLPSEGFGFLVPSSEPFPILGVIYDSCCFPHLDRKRGSTTRLTVMMGGHWFESLFGSPDEVNFSLLQDAAIESVRKALNIKSDPITALTALNRDCIAQYKVGHKNIIQSAFGYIQDNQLPLSLIGSSYQGVGVNDCVLGAKKLVDSLVGEQ